MNNPDRYTTGLYAYLISAHDSAGVSFSREPSFTDSASRRLRSAGGGIRRFRADPNYHVENFEIINALTGDEYR